MSRRPRDARPDGGFSSIEFALLAPVAFLGVMMVIQVALWAHTRNLAQAAVHEIAVSRAFDSGPDDGVMNAYGLDRLEGVQLETTTIANTSGPDQIQVRLRGTYRGLISFIALPVDATASVPFERFRP